MFIRNISAFNKILLVNKHISILGVNNIHCSSSLSKFKLPPIPSGWPGYNEIVYPPRGPDEPPRPAEVTHYRANVKYSPKKLWYIAFLIRGLSVDEALKKLQFHYSKGADIVAEVVKEAQDMAVKEQFVEFKSNLWIADSFCSRSFIVHGMRYHGKGRYGILDYRYSTYYVRLREGRPPKHYYIPPETGFQKLENYIENHRRKSIVGAL